MFRFERDSLCGTASMWYCIYVVLHLCGTACVPACWIPPVLTMPERHRLSGRGAASAAPLSWPAGRAEAAAVMPTAIVVDDDQRFDLMRAGW